MFEIGEKVLCVDDSMQPHTIEELKKDVPNWVKKGQTYHIDGFNDFDFVQSVILREIRNKPIFFSLIGRVEEPGFALWRFEKLKEDDVYSQKGVEIEEFIH